MNKSAYTQVASIINSKLKQYDYNEFKPRVTIFDSSNVDPQFCDKWSLAANNELMSLLEQKGLAQDLFYSDNTYVVGDDDLYIEPYNSRLFNLAVL